MRQQERMRAPLVKPANVTLEQRLALGIGERPVGDSGSGIALHGLAKGDVVKHAVAELIDLIGAHGFIASYFESMPLDPFVPAEAGTQTWRRRVPGPRVPAFAGTNGE